MAKIRIIENTAIAGKHAAIGEVLDVDATTARQLLVAGKALPAPVEPEKPTTRVNPTTRKRSKKAKA